MYTFKLNPGLSFWFVCNFLKHAYKKLSIPLLFRLKTNTKIHLKVKCNDTENSYVNG